MNYTDLPKEPLIFTDCSIVFSLSIPLISALIFIISFLPLSGVSNLQPTGHMCPRMAMKAAWHKIVNLLKTLWDIFLWLCVAIFFKDFFITFRERRREGEREERNINVREIHWSVVSHTPPTGDLAQNPGLCPDWESNQQPFGLQAGAQSTEPHQPGQHVIKI